MKYFIDTNIFLRALLNDHPQHTPASQQLLARIKEGSIDAFTTDLVIAEIVFVLTSHKTITFTKKNIRGMLKPILALSNLSTPSEKIWSLIFDLYVDKNIDFIDAYNIFVTKRLGIIQAFSFDQDLKKAGILKTLEP